MRFFNRKQYFFFFLCLCCFFTSIFACPSCAGSTEDNRYTYVVYVLMGFIALIYIPFFILYRMVYKYRKKDPPLESSLIEK